MAGIRFFYRFIPLRFSPKADKYVGMVITVENRSEEPKLLSADVVIKTQGQLGLDPSAVHKKGIKKIGRLNPGEKKEVMVKIYALPTAQPGEYEIDLYLNEHYLDYDKILARWKKEATLRVID